MTKPIFDYAAGDVEFLPSEKEVTIYANIARTMATPEEGIISFGLRDAQDPTKATSVAMIYISLSHMKRLSIALPEIIQRHEAIFGMIPVDPSEKLTDEGKEAFETALKAAQEKLAQLSK